MSLDVYLQLPGAVVAAGSGIFVRENGQTVELSRDEWDRRYPGRAPVACAFESSDDVFEANITHNLTAMAHEAGIYYAVWRPDECGIERAGQLVPLLEYGLAQMKREPARFMEHNPENGWGSYRDFVPWLERYLAACREYPDATIRVSR